MYFDRFDICEAYALLEIDWNVGGWLQDRPSCERRAESVGVQLHRIGYRAGAMGGTWESLSENARAIYTCAAIRLELCEEVDQTCGCCDVRIGGHLCEKPLTIRLSYSEDCWNEEGELVDPWNDPNVDSKLTAQTVVVYCDDVPAAEADQSIDGSSWETPSDMNVAYTVLMDYDGKLDERLRADGYAVTYDESTYAIDRE